MAILAFAIWMVYGVILWRRSGGLLERLAEIPAGIRAARATLLLLGSAAFMFLVFFGVWSASPKEIPPWGWAVIIVAGIGFVHAQVIAAAMLISTAIRK